MDNDSRLFSLAGLLTRANGDVFGITVGSARINRDGGPHAISAVPLDLDSVELRYSRELGAVKVSAGIGYSDPPIDPDSSSGVQGFVVWQQGF
jgi:hypothetical protein